MDDAKVLHACCLLHDALRDDLEVRQFVVHVERDRVSITIDPKHGIKESKVATIHILYELTAVCFGAVCGLKSNISRSLWGLPSLLYCRRGLARKLGRTIRGVEALRPLPAVAAENRSARHDLAHHIGCELLRIGCEWLRVTHIKQHLAHARVINYRNILLGSV